MSFVALDLSLRSTGWAMWSRDQALPACGTWELAPSVDWAARAFVRLHKHLIDLNQLDKIEALVFEEPVPTHMLRAQTNAATEAAKFGLVAHAMSFSEAFGIRWRPINIAAWRRHFLGRMPRGTKRDQLKAMAMRRARELGFEPLKHDAAEACGILDYQLSMEGILPPWRADFKLESEFSPGGVQAA